MRLKKRSITGFIIFSLATGLAGCGGINEMFYGEKDGPPLEGERETIIVENDPLASEQGIGGVSIPAAHTNASWSQPGGVPSNAPGHLSAGASLNRVWSIDAGVGSSGNGRLTASPVIDGGRVYVIDARANVSAYSAAGGKRYWRVGLKPKGESAAEGYGGGVAASGGRIFATTGFGTAVALDASTGRRLWEKKLGSPVRSSPTATGGKVYLVTVDNRIFCLSASDGEVIWDFRRYAESAGVLGSPSPAVSGNNVVAPYSSGEIINFNTETGKPAWADSFSRTQRLSPIAKLSTISGRPVIDRGLVFAISHSGRMGAVNLKTGERVWARNIGGTQTPWVAGNSVFVVSLSGKLYALDRLNGKLRWMQNLNKAEKAKPKKKGFFRKKEKPAILWNGPVLAGGRLLLVSSDGRLVTVSPQDGRVIGGRKLGGKYLIPPVVANGMVYVLSNSARLTAFR
ncbi:MAG TPA: pyrrolo-quinoline quinone [Rhizobiales bacterium]|nr:pyrrolo-quinoline quinone [Hyphomicrobiales bacterium]